MTAQNELRLRLSRRESELVSEYGYPFDDLSAQHAGLENASGSVTVTMEPFYLDALLADLVRSAKETEDQQLLDELDALFAEIEVHAVGQGYRP